MGHRKALARLTVACAMCALAAILQTRPAQLAHASALWTSIGPGGGGWIMAVAPSPHRENEVWLGGDIQGIFQSQDNGARWTIHNDGLRDYWIETFLFHPADPNIIYAGGTSGVYKSVDGGISWSWLREGFPPVSDSTWSAPVSALAIDPSNPDVIYAGIGTPRGGYGKQGAIYRSADAGASWTRVNAAGSLPADALITSLLVYPSAGTPSAGVTPTSTLYATSQYGFFISRDGGVNWTASNSGLPHTNIARAAISPRNPDVLFVTLYTPQSSSWRGGVYRSNDGGRTWSARNAGLLQRLGTDATTTSNYKELAIDSNDPQTVYVGTTDYVSPTLYRTTDGGASWVAIVNKPQASTSVEGWGAEHYEHTVKTLRMSPLNPKVLYFGSSVAVYRTADGGQTWQQVYTQQNGDGSTQTTGLEITASHFVLVDPRNWRRVFFGYQDVGLFVSQDGGNAMSRRVGGLSRATANTAYAVALDPNDSEHMWASFGPWESASSGFVIAESRDGARTWTPRTRGLPDKAYKRLLLDDSRAPRRLLVTANGAGIYASDDEGANWLATNTGLAQTDVRDLVADPSSPGTYWTVTAGRGAEPAALYRSDDRGSTWKRVSAEGSLTAWDVKQLAVSSVMYLAARRTFVAPRAYPGGIYSSSDGGQTWTLVLEDAFANAVAVDPGDPRVVYAGLTDHPFHDNSRGNGLKVSRDAGLTWSDLPTPTGRISVIAFDPGDTTRLFVGTSGNGVLRLDLSSTATSRRR